jgi:twitching motility protein PilT
MTESTPTAPTAQPDQKAGAPEINLRLLLQEMIQKGASDLHVTAGVRAKIRIDGDLVDSAIDYVLRPKDTL